MKQIYTKAFPSNHQNSCPILLALLEELSEEYRRPQDFEEYIDDLCREKFGPFNLDYNLVFYNFNFDSYNLPYCIIELSPYKNGEELLCYLLERNIALPDCKILMNVHQVYKAKNPKLNSPPIYPLGELINYISIPVYGDALNIVKYNNVLESSYMRSKSQFLAYNHIVQRYRSRYQVRISFRQKVILSVQLIKQDFRKAKNIIFHVYSRKKQKPSNTL